MTKAKDAKEMIMDKTKEEAVTTNTTKEKEVILFKRDHRRGG